MLTGDPWGVSWIAGCGMMLGRQATTCCRYPSIALVIALIPVGMVGCLGTVRPPRWDMRAFTIAGLGPLGSVGGYGAALTTQAPDAAIGAYRNRDEGLAKPVPAAFGVDIDHGDRRAPTVDHRNQGRSQYQTVDRNFHCRHTVDTPFQSLFNLLA